MNKAAAATALFIAFLAITSCKKKQTDPVPATPVMQIPSSDEPYMASIFAPSGATTDLGSPVTAWGVFLSVYLESGMKDTSGTLQYYYNSWAEALFSNGDGTGFSHPRSVSINNEQMDLKGNYYLSTDLLRLGALNHWEAASSSEVPEISQNVMASFPDFSGSFPDTISRNAGFSYTFNQQNTKNGDSAYVIIYSNGKLVRSNTASVKNGVVKITSAQLSGISNGYFNLNGNIFYGALVERVIYSMAFNSFSDKQFAFVNQRESLGKVVLK